MMRTVNSKADYFRLCEAGIFGNSLRLWGTLDEVKEDGYTGVLSARVRRSTGGGHTRYNIKSIQEAEEVLAQWQAEGVQQKEIYFNESAPDEFLVSQGELMLSTNFYSYFYCNEKLKMRDAMKKGRQMEGLQVKMYLQSIMTPASYHDVQDLLNEFSDSVIELSVYDRCLGSRPGRNTLIWEVRNY